MQFDVVKKSPKWGVKFNPDGRSATLPILRHDRAPAPK